MIPISSGLNLNIRCINLSQNRREISNSHSSVLPHKSAVNVKERQDKFPSLYWLPKLHKRPYKARFIANSISCTTKEVSKLLTSCLTAVKYRFNRYCETLRERSRKICLVFKKNSDEILSKVKSKGFNATTFFHL